MSPEGWGGRTTVEAMGATVAFDGDSLSLDEYQTAAHRYEADAYNPTPTGLCAYIDGMYGVEVEVVER